MRLNSATLPAWLVDELIERGHEVITRSETLEEMHRRVELERGQRWDEATRRWVDIEAGVR
jgi:hypothetical protein